MSGTSRSAIMCEEQEGWDYTTEKFVSPLNQILTKEFIEALRRALLAEMTLDQIVAIISLVRESKSFALLFEPSEMKSRIRQVLETMRDDEL